MKDEPRPAMAANTPHIVFDELAARSPLPLLIRSETAAGLPLLDTTEIHVRAIVDRLSRTAYDSPLPA